MTDKNLIASITKIEMKTLLIRGQKVMLNADLAELYDVETKRLNEQMRRNADAVHRCRTVAQTRCDGKELRH
jgi:hypothetical protein